jgi:hypothetical protein
MVPRSVRRAILNLMEAVLAERFGLQFQAGPRDDGLGPTRVAGVVLASGRRLPPGRAWARADGLWVVADYEDLAEPEPVTELLAGLVSGLRSLGGVRRRSGPSGRGAAPEHGPEACTRNRGAGVAEFD